MKLLKTAGHLPGRFFLTLVALAGACGCEKPPAAPPAADPGPMKVVEDPTGGYKLAIPKAWVKKELERAHPLARWFAAVYAPEQEGIPDTGIYVHLMAPGLPVASLENRFTSAPITTSGDQKNYKMLAAGPGTVGSFPSFRVECSYTSGSAGDLFECHSYIETSEGRGLMVSSRAPAGSEAMGRARLEAALKGFESIPRAIPMEVKVDPSGWTYGIPAGFDAPPHVARRAFVLYLAGGIDMDESRQRHEMIALLAIPPSPTSLKFEDDRIAELKTGLVPGKTRVVRLLGQEATACHFTPGPKSAQFEMAFAFATFEGVRFGLCVQALAHPQGRAMELLEAMASKLDWKGTIPEFEMRTVAEGDPRRVPVPKGWLTRFEGESFVGMEKENGISFLASFHPDATGEETPKSRSQIFTKADPKLVTLMGVEEFTLPDGRPAASLAALIDGGVQILTFVRVTPGVIGQVISSGATGELPRIVRLSREILPALAYAPADALKPANADNAAAGARVLDAVVARARKLPARTHWYILEDGGKPVGALRTVVNGDGSWVENDARSSPDFSVLTQRTASPGKVVELLRFTGKINSSCTSTLELKPGGLDALRVAGGENRHALLPTGSPFLPPDIAGTDLLTVALAEEAEGTYTFQIPRLDTMSVHFREFRVKGTEEVEIAGSKVKARRVEFGRNGVSWVADGRVVMEKDGTSYVRRISSEEEAKVHLKE